ncbi:13E12 repeat family protein, partial [Mycolicibacterium komossense]
MSSGREAVLEALAGLEGAVEALAGVSWDGLAGPDVVQVLARLETLTRRQAVIEHRLIGTLIRDGSAKELGAKNFSDVLTTALRISPKDAKRRLRDAEELGERRSLTGELLAPRMPHVAAGQAAGVIGGEHSAIIRGFFTDLPVWVDAPIREKAEAELAG